MNIHEYQAKSLLQKFGVSVPRGGVAYTPEEAQRVARDLGGPVWVVKAQIHAGGRGAGRFKDDPKGTAGGAAIRKSSGWPSWSWGREPRVAPSRVRGEDRDRGMRRAGITTMF